MSTARVAWDGSAEHATLIINRVLSAGGTARYVCSQPDSGPCKPGMPHHLAIDVPGGTIRAEAGSWIVHDGNGRFRTDEC